MYRNNFTSSNSDTFYLFFFLPNSSVIISSTILNICGKRRHSYLVPNLREKTFFFLPYMSFNMLRWFSSILSLISFFFYLERVLNVGKCIFLHQLRWSCDYSPFHSVNVIYSIDWFLHVELFLNSRNKSVPLGHGV